MSYSNSIRQPNDREESIIWLKDKTKYAYLREGLMSCHHRKRFPLKKYDPAKYTDGGKLSHIVAYAVLSDDAEYDTMPGNFERRYWWVKEYDRFEGGVCRCGGYMENDDSPAEAVEIDSIKPNLPSVGFGDDLVLCIE